MIPSVGVLSGMMINDHYSIKANTKRIEVFEVAKEDAEAKELVYSKAIESLQNKCNYTEKELEKKADKNIMELVLKKLDKIDEKLDKR
jgi:hypothetical protein